MEIYKNIKKFKNNNDSLTFISSNPGVKSIPTKRVLSVRIIAGLNNKLDGNYAENDYVIIELPWYEKGNIVRPRFKVKEETVKEVLAGLNELREDKKQRKSGALRDISRGVFAYSNNTNNIEPWYSKA